MNTAVMNGNTIDGQVNVASTMVRQDTGDTGRYYEPIMAPSLVDTVALENLHQNILVALRSGTAPWFADVLRDYDEIGDLSDEGPAQDAGLMRGADGRCLALTRRQVSIIRAGRGGDAAPDPEATRHEDRSHQRHRANAVPRRGQPAKRATRLRRSPTATRAWSSTSATSGGACSTASSCTKPTTTWWPPTTSTRALVGPRLLLVAGVQTVVDLSGSATPAGRRPADVAGKPGRRLDDGVVERDGRRPARPRGPTVTCHFTKEPSQPAVADAEGPLASCWPSTCGCAAVRPRAPERRAARGDRREPRRAGRADAEPVLAVAERLPRVRLLLLGGEPPGLREHRGRPRTARASATSGSPRTASPSSTCSTTARTRAWSATTTCSRTGRAQLRFIVGGEDHD